MVERAKLNRLEEQKLHLLVEGLEKENKEVMGVDPTSNTTGTAVDASCTYEGSGEGVWLDITTPNTTMTATSMSRNNTTRGSSVDDSTLLSQDNTSIGNSGEGHMYMHPSYTHTFCRVFGGLQTITCVRLYLYSFL